MLSYSATKGHDSRWIVMASDLVGRTRFELTGKITDLSWARGSGPVPGAVIGPGQGRYGSDGLGEGDLEAEGLDLADVVTELAVGVGPGLVVAGAEVGVPDGGVGEQVPDDGQDSSWVLGRGVPAKLGRRGWCRWSRAGVAGDRCAARAPAGAVTGSRVPDDGGGRPAGNRARPGGRVAGRASRGDDGGVLPVTPFAPWCFVPGG